LAKSSTEQSTRLDPYSEAYRREALGQGQAALNNAPSVASTNGYRTAYDLYNRAAGVGGIGIDALGGSPGAIDQLMNPYQTNVLDRMNAQYARMGQGLQTQLNQNATAQGAFGGSRAAVALGQGLGELGRAQGDANANLLYQGYGDAMSRAQYLTNLGLGSAGTLQQLDEAKRLEGYNNAAMKGQLFGMFPYGTDTKTEQNESFGATLGRIGAAGLQLGANFFLPGAGQQAAAGAGLGGGVPDFASMIPQSLAPTLPNYGAQMARAGTIPGVGVRGSFG
jgi:hypothetical protein